MLKSRLAFSAVVAVAALFIQSCTFFGYICFRIASPIPSRLGPGDSATVMSVGLPFGFFFPCGYMSFSGNILQGSLAAAEGFRPGAARPKKIRLGVDVSTPGGGSGTVGLTMKVKKDGSFFGAVPTPGFDPQNGFTLGPARTDCPGTELPIDSLLGVFVEPLGGTLETSDTVEVDFAARPIQELEECKKRLIETSKTPSKARWKKRPGRSTKKLVAISSKQGVEVHCVATSDGEQGTLKVTFTDGTSELIGITCND